MLFGSKKEKNLVAVCDGEVIPTEKIPDEVFSQGILGRGYGIIPENGNIVSPSDGIVEVVTDTSHAYTVKTNEGIEILIHIGVDSVSLEGKGFSPRVREGQRVKVGELLCSCDLDYISSMGISTVTAVLITNPEEIEIEKYMYGKATGGVSSAMYYRKKG
ncbi:MAG: PTS glucose transporter subunit IIA [Clostridia bacterium]|nr:PTS glucose transporter subunit IIA [Clostridia bacterium]